MKNVRYQILGYRSNLDCKIELLVSKECLNNYQNILIESKRFIDTVCGQVYKDLYNSSFKSNGYIKVI